MRRFSQKNQLVTLNDINITPLLDLAFVLLIIFIITTPMLEQNLKLTLPTGGQEGSTVRKDEVVTVEVNPAGAFVVGGRPYSLEQLQAYLAGEAQRRPDVPVYIRADHEERFKNVTAVLDICEKLGIKRVGFATRIEK